ncbi:hypothetical protein Ppa06_64570 [Planomonospora parontospora subsp. parontospora]|uniref:SsgA family sporulation/cell division regulator n=2 Tax=Planomonospora parontospora TaxID=58119 RepID=A0AA37F7M6_9ACTN|nr:SsgA family sporulation/cell division regulator [Planomonospora parontospora]GGK94241.1 hypothetical protein GCM10010126_62030 [Planomonospora parontospora]GII12659.1 hypothetical protein Ppa06_64570 [Planomonospora parontospora subsp. parontospora]
MSTSRIRTTLQVCIADQPNRVFKALAVYELTDPYAVHIDFPPPPGSRDNVWTFARSLLAQALCPARRGVVGEGDIRFAEAEATDYLAIILHPGTPAACRLYARRDELTSFLSQTYRRVPAGSETDWVDGDWDRALVGLVRKMRRDAA